MALEALSSPNAAGGDVQPRVGGTPTPVQQFTKVFVLQSYFDTTLLQQAILSQAQNSPIVASTFKEEQCTPAWALGLHPTSQCPVAVEFRKLGSQTLTLKPGEVIYPGRQFNAFAWGLPFGWLGGGLAHLCVFKTPETVLWHGNPEILFHRVRVAIKQPTDLAGLNNAVHNWPTRFPWTQAIQGANNQPQSGNPVIAVTEQTRMEVALFRTPFVAQTAYPGGDIRLIYQGTQDFELISTTNTQGLTNPVFEDIHFPAFTLQGAGGNLSLQRPVLNLTGPGTRLAADDGGMVPVDLNANFTGGVWFLDVCRYGRL